MELKSAGETDREGEPCRCRGYIGWLRRGFRVAAFFLKWWRVIKARVPRRGQGGPAAWPDAAAWGPGRQVGPRRLGRGS